MLVYVVSNVAANNIASRFAAKVNVRWNAMGSIVCRNVNRVLAIVIFNVVAKIVSRFAIKLIVHWNATDHTVYSNVRGIKTAACCSAQLHLTQTITSASRLVPPMMTSAPLSLQ